MAFTTPSGLAAWYKRQERQGIYDDDLIEAVYALREKFSGVRSDVFASGQPLWAVLNAMQDTLPSRAEPSRAEERVRARSVHAVQ